MDILILNGSPNKKGACAKVISEITKKLKGNTIKEYYLNGMKISGCQECFNCRKNHSDVCAIKDELSEVLELAKTTDVIVAASPVFYGDISAQLKCFIDRTWSYFGNTGFSSEHLPRNRKLIFILSYGYDDDKVYNQIFDKYKYYFNLFGFEECYFIKAYGAQFNDPVVKNVEEYKKQIALIPIK